MDIRWTWLTPFGNFLTEIEYNSISAVLLDAQKN